jgi:hypothetical protein
MYELKIADFALYGETRTYMRVWELIYETTNTPVQLGKLRISHFSSGYRGALTEEAPFAALHMRADPHISGNWSPSFVRTIVHT